MMKPDVPTTRERWMLAALVFYGALLIAGAIAIALRIFHFHRGTK